MSKESVKLSRFDIQRHNKKLPLCAVVLDPVQSTLIHQKREQVTGLTLLKSVGCVSVSL